MKRGRFRRVILFGALGLTMACLAIVSLSAVSNLALPSRPATLDRLEPLDKARLAESLRLKQTLGDTFWPGWGKDDIPVILWNRDYSFLIGFPDPPEGWERVPGDDFDGQPYYRQPSHDPQNFAVRVGDRWAASIATKWETDDFLVSKFREMMPGPLKPVFPYLLLIQPSEVQITAVLHEGFHVYQAEDAGARLEQAEHAYGSETAYWAADAAMHAEWEAEIDALARALAASSPDSARDLVREFLAQRDARRTAHHLSSSLVSLEQLIEWEEGLAKYVELGIWREAAETPDYVPLPALQHDANFKSYTTFNQRWSQEFDQMKRQAAQEGVVRFYYTGMAQAFLLDRLMPNWKPLSLSEGTTLEALLREAVV